MEDNKNPNGPFPLFNQSFYLNKSRQKFHYSLKEHNYILPKLELIDLNGYL